MRRFQTLLSISICAATPWGARASVTGLINQTPRFWCQVCKKVTCLSKKTCAAIGDRAKGAAAKALWTWWWLTRLPAVKVEAQKAKAAAKAAAEAEEEEEEEEAVAPPKKKARR